MFDLTEVLKSVIWKTRRFPPNALTAGTAFTLGSPSSPRHDHRWRVSKMRIYLGISHAVIEQPSTGKTKTVAASVLLRDRTFHRLNSEEGERSAG